MTGIVKSTPLILNITNGKWTKSEDEREFWLEAFSLINLNKKDDGVGTWRFTNNWHGLNVKMSYDFLGYYTEILGNQGIQLDLSNTYVVRPGDTLWLVAYQHGISVEELLKINGLTYDSILRVGQKLQVA